MGDRARKTALDSPGNRMAEVMFLWDTPMGCTCNLCREGFSYISLVLKHVEMHILKGDTFFTGDHLSDMMCRPEAWQDAHIYKHKLNYGYVRF